MNKKFFGFAFFVLLFLTCQAFSQEQTMEKRAWRGEDLFKIKRIGGLQVSPDNEYLLFVLRETDLDKNRDYSTIWILATKEGSPIQLTDPKGSVSSPRWSPDGYKIAFFSSDKDGLGLWIMNKDGSGRTKLCGLEKSNAYLGMKGCQICWSPNGDRIAFTAAGPRHYKNIPSPQNPPTGNDVMVVDRLLYKSFYYYSDLRRTYVWVISSDGGDPQQISFGEYDYHSISWSPKGDKIACVSNKTGRDDFNANNDLCLLSPEGEELIQLTHTIGPEYSPLWSPDGKSIAFLGRTRGHRSKESDAELYKVYVMDTEGENLVNLTSSLDRWSQSPAWSYDSQKIYFTAQNLGRVGLYVATAEGGKVSSLIDEVGQVGSYAISKNSEIFYVFTDFTHPPEIYKTNVHGQKKEKLTDFNNYITDRMKLAEIEEFTFKSFDGLKIQGWLMKPLDLEKGIKYPLIHAIHGGPHGQYGYSLSRTAFYQFLASHGYAVMFLNYRGSTGRGQEFSDLIVGDLCGAEHLDLKEGLDFVLENFEFLDPQRLGVTGVSYGGYLSNWIITQTDRYKAAVPVSSISHILTDWGNDANPLWFESDGGFMPIDDFERALEMSPIKYVKNCTTPTLFIHGAWDFCTNLNQAELMFAALKILGVETVLAIYPNEGHGIHNQPKHTFDYHQRTLDWFDEHLK